MRTAVYRCFDAQGRLLYIGASKDPAARYEAHAARADWMQSVVNITLEWHDSRSAAYLAEEAAIKAERPMHNAPQDRRGRKKRGDCPCTGDLAAAVSIFPSIDALTDALNRHPSAPKAIGRGAVSLWKQRDTIPHAWRPVVSDMLARAERGAA